MHRFTLWAPSAKTVDVQVSDRRIRMTRDPAGWWHAEVPQAGAGTDYGFCIDGGDPLPDPRSAHQPHGVHGLSRIVDHAAFQWTDRHWQSPPLASAVIYEMHVGTFTPAGTFESAIERLDHLVDLGVTHVELMPVAEFSGRWGWGYDGVDLYAPHHAYGGPDGLKPLVNACHQRGLGVILDVVYNHLGPSGNYLSQFGPYFTSHHTTPWGDAINFDGPDSDPVRRFLCDNALMWLRDYHIDGLRLDAVHQIIDTSATNVLEQMAQEIEDLSAALGRHLFVIAESDLNNPRLVWHRDVGGYDLDAQWNEDFHHALHGVLTGERKGYYVDFGQLADLAKSIQHVFVHDGCYSPFRRRAHGRPAANLPGSAFVTYMQNHDQVGNRAVGDRMSSLIGLQRLKVGAALLMTAPFVPLLFMGEEWAAATPFQYFTNHPEPELGRAVSQGRKREFAAFGWDPAEVPDPQDETTFQRSKLDWDEPDRQPHAEILDWYKRLIRLRRSAPALSTGRREDVRVRFDEDDKWLVIQRGPVAVACNFDDKPHTLPLPPDQDPTVLLASSPSIQPADSQVELPAESVAILGPDRRM